MVDPRLVERIELVLVPLLLAGGVIAFMVARRDRLRPRHLTIPLIALLLTGPLSWRIVGDLRSHAGGEAGAWGRMGELFILLGVAPIAFVSAVALATTLLLLPGRGFASEAALRDAPRAGGFRALFRPRSEREIRIRFFVSVAMLGVGLVLSLLLGRR